MNRILCHSWLVFLTTLAMLPSFAASGGRPGSIDNRFVPEPRNGTVLTSVEQPDGCVLVGGYFGVIRMLADGRTDPSFQAPLTAWPYPGMPPIVSALALLPDGSVLVGGQFQIPGTSPAINLARLMPDGSRDEAFGNGAHPNWPVESIARQDDGRILIGGRFETYGTAETPSIARLLADGTLDPTFHPGSGPDEFVFGILVQSDGRVLIRGNFSDYDGVPRRGLARLLPDGSLDLQFQPEAIATPWVSAMAFQGNRLLVSVYQSDGREPRHQLIRLEPGGELDPRFRVSLDQGLQSIAVQMDGRIIIGGFFKEVCGTARIHVARLTINGRVDLGFDVGTGAAGQIDEEWASPGVYSLLLAKDRGILAGGNFSRFADWERSGIVRLHGGFASGN